MDLTNSAGLLRHDTWYFARLVYAVGRLPNHRTKVEEDLWLFKSASAEQVYNEAMAAAQSVAAGVISQAPYEGLAVNSTGSGYSFWGLASLRSVGSVLGQSVELDRFLVPAFRGSRCRTRRHLMAFGRPSLWCREQPIVSGDKSNWYLADQVFSVICGSKKSRSTKMRRLVLIKAEDAATAHELSVIDGKDCARLANASKPEIRFVGLRQLSLVRGQPQPIWVVRTDEYSVEASELPQLTVPKSQLQAFSM